LDKIRVGVVGAGYISRSYHCPALRRLSEKHPQLELAAICDIDPQRAGELARTFGFRTQYADIAEMLDHETLDAAWLLVPPSKMKEVALVFLKRRIPLLLEKPPGSNSAEVRELIDSAAANGVKCLVALNRRFIPLGLRLKELIEGLEHPPQLICGEMWRYRREDEDFGYSTAVHAIDTMRFLGGDVREARVEKLQLEGNRQHSYLVRLEYRSGAHGRLAILPEVGLNVERYTVHAHNITLTLEAPLEWTIDFPGRVIFHNGADRHFVQDNRIYAQRDPVETTGFFGESAHFLDCLINGGTPRPSLEDCLQSIEIAEAVQSGRNVDFH
jgi:myo-inositol 2-dehydrogenase / D-chiro-inositol 1-dehydrogenase